MKTIKMLSAILLLLLSTATFAQKKGNPKAAAKRIIRVTAGVIYKAHKAVKQNHVYTGHLAHAIAHQKYARKLYRAGKFNMAIHHSRRARHLAKMALLANKGKESDDMKYTKEDEENSKQPPPDAQMDKDLKDNMPNEPMKDEDVIKTEPDVDLGPDE